MIDWTIAENWFLGHGIRIIGLLVIKISCCKDYQSGDKRYQKINERHCDHIPYFRSPLIIHALSKLTKDLPWKSDVFCENIRFNAHDMFGEIDDVD